MSTGYNTGAIPRLSIPKAGQVKKPEMKPHFDASASVRVSTQLSVKTT